MESAFPQAAFASEVWQLDFSRQRDWFVVGNSRLGDFCHESKKGREVVTA